MEIKQLVEKLIDKDFNCFNSDDIKSIIDETMVLDSPLIVEKKHYGDRMDNLGSLVDKLITVSHKMWFNQEVLYEIRRMDKDEFKEKWGGDLDGLHDLIQRACTLNVQRSNLMDEIDSYLKKAISGEIDSDKLTFEQHKTY